MEVLEINCSPKDCDQTNANLCSFAASPAESQRLQMFLMNASSSARQQAAKIECSFRCRRSYADKSIEACLYAIRLPTVDTVFVALQTQAVGLESREQIPHAEATAETHEEIFANVGTKMMPDRRHKYLQRHRKGDFRQRRGALTDIPEEALRDPMLETRSEPESPTLAASPPQGRILADHHLASYQSVSQRGSQSTRQRSVTRPTNLRTNKLIQRKFDETPKTTLTWLVDTLLHQINPRGSGCCYWHVGLSILREHILELAMRQCDHKIFPYDGWQCKLCLSLHEDLDDDSDDDHPIRKCSVCQFEDEDGKD